jgi:hypothetical protein
MFYFCILHAVVVQSVLAAMLHIVHARLGTPISSSPINFPTTLSMHENIHTFSLSIFILLMSKAVRWTINENNGLQKKTY